MLGSTGRLGSRLLSALIAYGPTGIAAPSPEHPWDQMLADKGRRKRSASKARSDAKMMIIGKTATSSETSKKDARAIDQVVNQKLKLGSSE